jgi:hypothetical protein
MKRGRIIVGATVVGYFTIDNNGNISGHIEEDLSTVLFNSRRAILSKAGDSLEEVIRRVSEHGLLVGLDYPSPYAAGTIGKAMEDHKA